MGLGIESRKWKFGQMEIRGFKEMGIGKGITGQLVKVESPMRLQVRFLFV